MGKVNKAEETFAVVVFAEEGKYNAALKMIRMNPFNRGGKR